MGSQGARQKASMLPLRQTCHQLLSLHGTHGVIATHMHMHTSSSGHTCAATAPDMGPLAHDCRGALLQILWSTGHAASERTARLAWNLKPAWQAAWRLWVGLVSNHILCG